MVEKLDPNASYKTITRITDSEDLTDLLIDVEDYFDSNDLYAFKNWINGIVVSGPYVSKYWVKLTLKYPYFGMPDPEGGLRLYQHGTRISFRIGHEDVPIKVKSEGDYRPGTKKPKMKLTRIWLVEILVPRRLVKDLDDEVLDLYDEEVDADSIDDANIDGIDTEDQFTQGQDNNGMDQNSDTNGGDMGNDMNNMGSIPQ
jgi:hypothetical protein